MIVATVGRAALTRATVDRLAEQTRPPDGVLVIGVSEADVAGVADARAAPEILLAPRGSCAQRNHGLDRVEGRADIVVFFDDDFLPAADYLEQIERLFADQPRIAGVTGDLIADGVKGVGITFDEALALLAADRPPDARVVAPIRALYGCNMAVRMAMATGVRFDEALPLYGWQEDIDYSVRLKPHGELVEAHFARGVHMGNKGGRTSGKRLGYSQVANPIYLTRKGTMLSGMATDLILRNVGSNLLRSLWSEPWIDRRGRLLGNLIAAADLLRGRLDPRRILEFR